MQQSSGLEGKSRTLTTPLGLGNKEETGDKGEAAFTNKP